MSAFNTAAERAASPIGALYPYLQHRSPECTESCVCGVREAVQAVERETRKLEQNQAGALRILSEVLDMEGDDDDQ